MLLLTQLLKENLFYRGSDFHHGDNTHLGLLSSIQRSLRILFIKYILKTYFFFFFFNWILQQLILSSISSDVM